MPWFPVDDSFHSHPKVLATSLAALGLWAKAGSWCMDPAHITDGRVPAHVLASLGDPDRLLAEELVTNRLWRRTRNNTYVFNDWFDWGTKRTAEQQRVLSAIRAVNGRKGGLAKSQANAKLGNREVKGAPDQGRRRSNLLSKTEANAKQLAKQNRSPLDPVPIPKEPPQPPAADAAGGHDGSHPNCRACGTNPRGRPPDPPPTPIPPPASQVLASGTRPARGRAVKRFADQARQAMRKEPP